MEERKSEKKVRKKIEDCITDEGLLVSGNGILAENTRKILEKLDKIQKFLFFMEQRQRKWHQEFQKLNNLPIERDYEENKSY